MVNLYCDTKKEVRGNAIQNMIKMSLHRTVWKKDAIGASLPTTRCKAAYHLLLKSMPTYAR